MSIEYRGYFITNMYTSGIHAGIQAAHCVHQLYSDYEKSPVILKKIRKWANFDKTLIVLNGGYHSNLEKIFFELSPVCSALRLPISKWSESKEALNGATTCVGLIVPDRIWKAPSVSESFQNNKKIFDTIKSLKLAT